jgi:hypothetical protein
MNDREAMLAVAKVLNDCLEDPRYSYTKETRSWAHTDKPLSSGKYPRIQVQKSEPGIQEIIGIGEEFPEWNTLILDIWFYTDNDFKYVYDQSAFLEGEELCREYQDKIGKVLKSNQSVFKSQYGITGYKVLARPEPSYDNKMQKNVIRTTIRLWYFDK